MQDPKGQEKLTQVLYNLVSDGPNALRSGLVRAAGRAFGGSSGVRVEPASPVRLDPHERMKQQLESMDAARANLPGLPAEDGDAADPATGDDGEVVWAVGSGVDAVGARASRGRTTDPTLLHFSR